MGKLVAKVACRSCQKSGRDKSKDNFALYDDGSGFCFSCGYTVRSKDFKEEEPEITFEGGALLTPKELEVFKENSTYKGKGFRGIRDATYEAFSVRHTYDTTTGQLVAQHYPCTTGYNLTGYKRRKLPKIFDSLKLVEDGVGQKCDLFGQINFRSASNNKYLLVVGGEIDQLSAFQMLADDLKRRDKGYGPIAVVCSIIGEKGAWKQLQAQYEWVNKFERIVLCFDNDEAGREATELAVKVLPKGKAYIMDMELKDPNEYLAQGREQQFVSSFYASKLYTPAGIVSSNSIMKEMQSRALTPKVSLPEFLHTVQEMLCGGFNLKNIINVVAGTSIGKTTLVNACVRHWIFDSPYLVGVVTLEADVPEYGDLLLSEEIGRKIPSIKDPQEKHNLLHHPDVIAKAHNLFTREDGQPRFFLIDDRGDFDSLQKKIEELIIRCGVQLIVIDPLSDALAGMPPEEQELFMKWQKQTVKRYDVTFVNIIHIRKAVAGQKDAGRGTELDESQMFGSSSIAKSAHVNILLSRNKYADDDIEKNTTKVTIAKAQGTGKTGKAGEIYYEDKTHKLWDKEDWLKLTSSGN